MKHNEIKKGKNDKQERIDFFENLYNTSKAYADEDYALMQQSYDQYCGDNKIDPLEEGEETANASVVRNITYELIESQISSRIPAPSVRAKVYSEKNERNARSIEKLLQSLRDQLPFEQLNDMDERYSPIYGGSVFLIEWDETEKTHNENGNIRVTLYSPKHFVGQPKIYNVQDMEYCFLIYESTRADLTRRYDISEEEAELARSDEDATANNDNVTVKICYYKNEEDKICQYIWSGDAELEFIEDYYSRKNRVCAKCGKPESECKCSSPKIVEENAEFETLARDVVLSDGSILPANSIVIENGVAKTEKKTVDMIMPNGSVAVQDVADLTLPMTQEVVMPVYENTKIPYFHPTKFPIVIRRNTSKEESLWGKSDCEVIRPQQQEVNKRESTIAEKLNNSGVFSTVPSDLVDDTVDNSKYKKVYPIQDPNQKSLFGTFDTQVNINQDAAQSDRAYDHAKRILGISDSFQGQADSSASSGVAKQLQIQQSAGRLDSKRRMKDAAYADIDAIIFEMFLAYADEKRNFSYTDFMGNEKNAVFNRYDFIERDMATGEYYYNTDYLFSIDGSGDVEKTKELMWQQIMSQFQIGAFGNPAEPNTLLIYWRFLEKAHYPNARVMVEMYKSQIQQMQAAQQQAMADMQNQNRQLQERAAYAEQNANDALSYAEYIKNLNAK